MGQQVWGGIKAESVESSVQQPLMWHPPGQTRQEVTLTLMVHPSPRLALG